MKNPIDRISASLDAKRELLAHIKDVNTPFYNELIREHLTDRLTFTNFERDLARGLAAIGITIFIKEHDQNNVFITYKLKTTEVEEIFPDYEAALKFAIGLLNVKKI